MNLSLIKKNNEEKIVRQKIDELLSLFCEAEFVVQSGSGNPNLTI